MALTKSDLNAIDKLMDAKLEEKLEAKLEAKLDAKLANYATKDDLKQLRQDMLGDKAEILGAINKKSEDDDAHKMLHHNLGEDVPDLQRQVKHLYKTFEIDMPISPVY